MQDWPQENIVKVEKKNFRYIVEKISRSEDCRYPLLAIRILIHAITEIDTGGHVHISARHLSRALDVHYDTVTKRLKYLRSIEAL